ncbi:hypothetical protein ACSFCX_06525 [Yokenella regensburgei]|uniref:hypothetical protein n=1 Tax=Yokenella regensburgei TaxID=158877 RepID=UPI003EDABCE7
MSTVIYPFSGDELKSLFFSPFLNGKIYDCQIKWNVYSQRWFINITDNSGNRRLTFPVVASPVGYDINLLLGAFGKTKMVWRVDNAQIEVIN